MQKKEFEYVHDVNDTVKVRVRGYWQIVNGWLEYYIEQTDYSHGGILWSLLPYSIIKWLDTKEEIDRLTYDYIKQSCVHADQPDTTTDRTQTEADLLLNNKLD